MMYRPPDDKKPLEPNNWFILPERLRNDWYASVQLDDCKSSVRSVSGQSDAPSGFLSASVVYTRGSEEVAVTSMWSHNSEQYVLYAVNKPGSTSDELIRELCDCFVNKGWCPADARGFPVFNA